MSDFKGGRVTIFVQKKVQYVIPAFITRFRWVRRREPAFIALYSLT